MLSLCTKTSTVDQLNTRQNIGLVCRDWVLETLGTDVAGDTDLMVPLKVAVCHEQSITAKTCVILNSHHYMFTHLHMYIHVRNHDVIYNRHSHAAAAAAATAVARSAVV